ncbi:hypothetical protein [Alteromonas phage XX1924]|nr:hypothetical protein [Alteromonas phage XX1924]
MPFKQGKSPADVAKRINKALTQDLPKDIEKGLFTMYTHLAGTADFYVPIDTGALIKSRSHRIRKNGEGWTLTYGYYTDYAAVLHNRNNWRPRLPNSKGKNGGGYNENARSQWMNVAWNEVGDEAKKLFANMIEPK